MTSRADTFYEHTQTARTTLLVFLGMLPVLVAAFVLSEWGELAVVGSVVLAVVMILALVHALARLRVEVGQDEVVIAFSYGWPRRVIRRSDIVSFEAVRNRAIYGWGIRWIPRGWMWNVWGLDAVELRFADGRRFRIGTDDPDGLVGALTT